MSRLTTLASDMLKAAIMQISIWRWEAHMIARYGPDWSYKPVSERMEGGWAEERDH